MDSPDHLIPYGTKNDNSTDPRFVDQVLGYFNNRPITFMDLGCAGGQLVIDFHNRGCQAIGLEGSDYSVVHARANWPEHHNKRLFTANICKPYIIRMDDAPVLFDCITTWEVLEHPKPYEIIALLSQVHAYLAPGGIFTGSVSLVGSGPAPYHQTVWSRQRWQTVFSNWFEDVKPCPIINWVRPDCAATSHYFCMKKRSGT